MIIDPSGKGRPVNIAGDPSDDAVLSSTGIDVQQRDSTGAWVTVRRIYPREFFAETAVDTMLYDPIRLLFIGHHALRGVGWLEPSGYSAIVHELPMVAANHNRSGEVLSQLADSDTSTVQLVTADTLSLAFAATVPDSGQARDYMLLAEGTYTTANGDVMPLRSDRSAPEDRRLRFALLQNRPNPFGNSTTIAFELASAVHVRLDVFDVSGRRVSAIANRMMQAGHWSLQWDGRDAHGDPARPGVYLYRLVAGAFEAERKMVLLP